MKLPNLKLEEKIRKKNEIKGTSKPEPKKTEKPEKVEVKKVEDHDIESEFEQEVESASSDGEVNQFKLKIKMKETNGKTIVETNSGEMVVENGPEEIANDLVKDEVLDKPISVDTKIIDNNVNFEVKGVENKKLFGLFNIEIPKIATVDSKTGEIVSTKQSFWMKVLGFLSK